MHNRLLSNRQWDGSVPTAYRPYLFAAGLLASFSLLGEVSPHPIRDGVGDDASDCGGECPEALAVAPVNENDSEAPPRVPVTFIVRFEPERIDIPADQEATIRQTLELLRKHPNNAALVEGYADSSASPEINLALAERRAHNMRTYLVAAGIDSHRVYTVSGTDVESGAVIETPEGTQRHHCVAKIIVGVPKG